MVLLGGMGLGGGQKIIEFSSFTNYEKLRLTFHYFIEPKYD